MILTRRSLFGLLAAPAIIKVADLMPIRAPKFVVPHYLNLGAKFAVFGDGIAFVGYGHNDRRRVHPTNEGALLLAWHRHVAVTTLATAQRAV
jgi:hypothetical protein